MDAPRWQAGAGALVPDPQQNAPTQNPWAVVSQTPVQTPPAATPDQADQWKVVSQTPAPAAPSQQEQWNPAMLPGVGAVNLPPAVATGVKEAGEDIWDTLKGVAAHPVQTAEGVVAGSPAGMFHQSVNESLGAYHAYEKARQAGKGIVDSLQAASDQMQAQDATAQMLQKRADEFKKQPGAATVHALANAAVLAATMYGGGEVAGGLADAGEAEASEVAANVAKNAAPKAPGPIQQILKGEKVAQPQAQSALRSGAEAATKKAGVQAGESPSIRTMLDEPIEKASAKETSLYQAVNKAAETDMKTLYDWRERLHDALDDPAQISQRKDLQQELAETNTKINWGENNVKTKLGKDAGQLIDQAKAATQQRYAMEEGAKKLFNNESVIKGNAAHGAEEKIDVDAAIKNAENLDKSSKFAPRGSPTRLRQMFGEEGALKFKQSLYDAKKLGAKALTKQQWATRLAAIGGTSAAIDLIKSLF